MFSGFLNISFKSSSKFYLSYGWIFGNSFSIISFGESAFVSKISLSFLVNSGSSSLLNLGFYFNILTIISSGLINFFSNKLSILFSC